MRILIPVKSYLTRNSGKFELDSDGLSRWIGYCAVGLPLAMLYGVYVGWPFGKVCFATSISHFYYTRGFGDIFVGILFFIAIFLYNFRGKKQIDTFCATAAGFFALGVALFPTTGAPCVYHNQQARILTDMPDKVTGALPDFFMASEWSNYLHLGSAALLFIFLAWYSFSGLCSSHPRLLDIAFTPCQLKQSHTTSSRHGHQLHSPVHFMCLLATTKTRNIVLRKGNLQQLKFCETRFTDGVAMQL